MSSSVACVSALMGLKLRLPHSLTQSSAPDVRDHRRLEAGIPARPGKRARGTLGLRVVDLSDREAVALDVPDDARLGDFGRRVNDATEHPVGRQVVRQ